VLDFGKVPLEAEELVSGIEGPSAADEEDGQEEEQEEMERGRRRGGRRNNRPATAPVVRKRKFGTERMCSVFYICRFLIICGL
jgi:hypothetical protein